MTERSEVTSQTLQETFEEVTEETTHKLIDNNSQIVDVQQDVNPEQRRSSQEMRLITTTPPVGMEVEVANTKKDVENEEEDEEVEEESTGIIKEGYEEITEYQGESQESSTKESY